MTWHPSIYDAYVNDESLRYTRAIKLFYMYELLYICYHKKIFLVFFFSSSLLPHTCDVYFLVDFYDEKVLAYSTVWIYCQLYWGNCALFPYNKQFPYLYLIFFPRYACFLVSHTQHVRTLSLYKFSWPTWQCMNIVE